jgi:F-type H+-transporting ATPase subunit b
VALKVSTEASERKAPDRDSEPVAALMPAAHPADATVAQDAGATDAGTIDVGSLAAGPLGLAIAASVSTPVARAAGPINHTVESAAVTARQENGNVAATETVGGEHPVHPAFKLSTFVLQTLNFGVLLFLLVYFGGRFMTKSLLARHQQLKTEVAEAARLRHEAREKADAQDRRLAELEKEVSVLRSAMREEAAREQARMLESARERAQRVQDDMRFQLTQQIREAEMLLRAEVASASVRLAEELARRAVDMQDERRLAQEFVTGFDPPGGAQR